MFVNTSLPVGGAEMLLTELCRRMQRDRFQPEICLLKEPGPVGEMLASEMQVHTRLIHHKWDLGVIYRLWKLFRQPDVVAVITVGAGDKMFWGRIAAKLANVPVIASALHSTGWPDGVGKLNRLLTPITDAFIAVAQSHGEFLVNVEDFPEEKVSVIPNGVDCQRFAPLPPSVALREELGISTAAPVVAIVAALRPEKNHRMFLEGAEKIRQQIPDAHFLVVGDGPCRSELESLAVELKIDQHVHFLGARQDVPEILAASDLFTLTSQNEASPVSVLEAMSMERAVVVPDVGSISESVAPGQGGVLYPAGDLPAYVAGVCELLEDPLRRRELGRVGREFVVKHASVESMVAGYERLVRTILAQKGKLPDSIGS